ncbi:hypothetical protein Lbys_0132 [Leadbetterella byssophila DSM 17132]|uniref:Uncharacterized protein n=1 Tax=Leadbetterella byssophila (strain DSM 17132 / JCM 16389 / KACC 11308 / NBRC 106382 / 4M15) TaxID=649349 RepID=E4RSS8_LEAB4|nr:hypothetical protein [Leadbetterella byssophila]ADQ15928.1 hypothetical protein Lbys_0132 [Leadbetterella byssophila DSM 17132]
MRIDLNDIGNGIEALKNQSHDMGLIINPVINKYNLQDKEILEVCQIGKFLYRINPELRIADKPQPPNPDFIIKFDNKTIGLEHTRIVDTEKSQRVYSISNLFNAAAKEYQKNNPESEICATFRLKNDTLNFEQSDKKNIIQAINVFVNEAKNGNYQNQPDFIEEIVIMPNSVVSFSYLETNFRGKKLPLQELQNAISIKENKLEKYYGQSNSINEFWLVLMVGSLNSASFELDESLDYRTESKFDKVYLMSDFSEKIIEVKAYC